MRARKKEVNEVALAAMRKAFEEQLTGQLNRLSHRYARQRARMVRRAGRRIDRLYAHELVQDALTDTWLGQVNWDPTKSSLLEHVRDLIRCRSWKDALWAKRAPQLSLEVGDTPAAISAAASHRMTAPPQEHPLMIRGLTVAVVTELKRLAEGDHAAMAILDAWEEGKVDRGEVTEYTGLSQAEYRTARDRLTYLLLEIPSSLDEAARAYLRSAS